MKSFIEAGNATAISMFEKKGGVGVIGGGLRFGGEFETGRIGDGYEVSVLRCGTGADAEIDVF